MKPYVYNANRVFAGVTSFHKLDRDLVKNVLGFFAKRAIYDGKRAID